MLTVKLTKSIINKALLNNLTKSVYSTSGQERSSRAKQKPQRQLKSYQKLFYASPLMNINIEMIMAINQLRPKATYIIATKNGQFPKQINNSAFNIIQCLNYVQGFKYFYKSFPALSQNLTKILTQKIQFQATGIYKVNAIKKLIPMLSNVDCLHGQIFIELVSVFFIWSLQSSIKAKKTLIQLLKPLKQRKEQIQKKKKTLEQNKQSQNYAQTMKSLNDQILSIQSQIKKYIIRNRFMKQQDFLCALHYCLQRGYYSQTVIRQFVQNILGKNNYQVPTFEDFLQQQQEYFYEKPLSNIYNKRALIYCRMYSNYVYRIKILNQLKRMKKTDSKFMDFLKKSKNDQQAQTSQSVSQQSPFINGQKVDISSSSQSVSQQKNQSLSDKDIYRLIQESLIPKKSYLNLVNKYIQLLQRKDTLCYILTEEASSQSFRIMQTQFFSYLNQPQGNNQTVTLSSVKSRYLKIFKQIFNIEKNGAIYVESPFIQASFQVILKMYDYGDRKQIFELLKLYERYLVTKNVSQMRSLAPFYVFEKYCYKSNFVASKLFQYINFKYRLGRQQSAIKQQLILLGNDICRYLCLYFKLLENDLNGLFTQYEMNTGLIKPKILTKSQLSDTIESEQKQTNIRYQQQFQQAVQIFLVYFNKLISAVYMQRDGSGFIGKGLQLQYEFLRVKYLSTKTYEQTLYVEGKIPQEDIRKIIVENNDVIKQHRSYVKNVYEKQFETKQHKIQLKQQNNTKQQQISKQISLNYNRYLQTMFIRRNSILNPLDQISNMLEILQTAIQLQTLKNVQFYQDVLVVFKNIFQNKKLIKILSDNILFPQILKRMIKISQKFKGSYKNQSNKLYQSIFNLTKFNLNSFLHNSRISISKQLPNTDKLIQSNEKYQSYLHTLELNNKIQPNNRVWLNSFYHINKENVMNHVRSDILYCALAEHGQLQSILRTDLARIKTKKSIDNRPRFQLNYLQYPYIANLAININNELVLILVRKQNQQNQKPYNNVLKKYYEQCEDYYRKKGNKVIVVSNQNQIKQALKQICK